MLRSWLIRLITWDGLFPLAIWSAPFLVAWVLPNKRGAIETIAVLLPIVAFFVRYGVGRRYIASNHCHAIVRGIQVGALCLGLMVLALIDCVLMLTHVMPRGAAATTTGDLICWAVLFSVYLAMMAFALYPGRCSDPLALVTVGSEFAIDVCRQVGKLRNATHYRRALRQCEEQARFLEEGGTGARRLADAWSYLAALNLRLARHAAAEQYTRRAISVYEGRDGTNRQALATYYQLLSMVLAFGGRTDEAIPYAQRALTEFSTVYSPKSKFLVRRKAELVARLANGKVSFAFDF